MENVVICRDVGSNSSWWYPQFKYVFEKNLAPLSACITLSTVGVRCLSHSMAWFGILMSTQIRTASGSFGFRTGTIGEIHRVGPSTFSMMLSSSKCCSSASIRFLTWKGTLLWGCVTGGTSFFMCSLTWNYFNLPPHERDQHTQWGDHLLHSSPFASRL